jgi:hypothetical protein
MGMDDLRKWIEKLVKRPRERSLGERLPCSYLEVEGKIKKYLGTIVSPTPTGTIEKEGFEKVDGLILSPSFMSLEEFYARFGSGMKKEDVKAMLSFFHHQGLVLWQTPSKDSFFFNDDHHALVARSPFRQRVAGMVFNG